MVYNGFEITDPAVIVLNKTPLFVGELAGRTAYDCLHVIPVGV